MHQGYLVLNFAHILPFPNIIVIFSKKILSIIRINFYLHCSQVIRGEKYANHLAISSQNFSVFKMWQFFYTNMNFYLLPKIREYRQILQIINVCENMRDILFEIFHIVQENTLKV